MIAQKKDMIHLMQVDFSKFLNKFKNGISKPQQKFLKDSMNGIIKSQSCIVRQIAQELDEDISLKKTQERLGYHLKNMELNNNLSDKLLKIQTKTIKSNSLILIDPSDLIKKYAITTEGLSKIRDASEGDIKNGFEVLDIIGVNKTSSDFSLFPIHSQIHSNELGLDTLKNKIFNKILDIIIHSNNKGIFVMDRGFDDKKVYKELNSHTSSFIIKMRDNRNVIQDGNMIKLTKLVNRTKLNYNFNVSKKRKNKTTKLKAGIIDIEIPVDPHPVKNPETVKVKLVVGKFKKSKTRFILAANLPNLDTLDTRELCKFIIDSYGLRWKIEEVHRQAKQDFGWEEMKLQKFKKMQTLNTILWIVLSYIYRLKKWQYKFTVIFGNLMVERKKDVKKLKLFIYYRITKVTNYCFKKSERYRKIPFQKPDREKHQLRLSL